MPAENDHLFTLKSKEEIDASLQEKVMATFFTATDDKFNTYWYKHHVRFYIRDRIVFTFDVEPSQFKMTRGYEITYEIQDRLRAWLYEQGFDYMNITNTWSDRSYGHAYSAFKTHEYEAWQKRQQKKKEQAA